MTRTYSRYDFMQEGTQVDPVINSVYPDPLSLNYFDLKLSGVPKKDTMSSTKIAFFWKETENIYGQPVYDDIVLTLNGASHKNLLQPGDVIYFPATADMETSFKIRKA